MNTSLTIKNKHEQPRISEARTASRQERSETPVTDYQQLSDNYKQFRSIVSNPKRAA